MRVEFGWVGLGGGGFCWSGFCGVGHLLDCLRFYSFVGCGMFWLVGGCLWSGVGLLVW